METIDQSLEGENQLNYQSKEFLKETAKWTTFLSILGFIGVGFLVILAFSIGTIMKNNGAQLPLPTLVFTLIYLALAAIYLMPLIYLYKFSTNVKKALLDESDHSYAIAFMNLKSHYKFVGITTIVVLSLYAVTFLISLVSALL